jgi:predicted GNAT family N-acyltransferase
MKVQIITAQQTYPLRHEILRPGLERKTCFFEGDHLKSTIHFGLFKDDHLLSVVTYVKNKHSLFDDPSQYQLRGMATASLHQGKGLGSHLLKESLGHFQKNSPKIWCNARLVAVKFYQRHGFQINSQQFEIPGVGPHFVMSLKI